MCKKPNKSKLANKDRALIEENADAIDTLIVLAKNGARADGAKMEEALRAVQNKLRYLISSPDEKVLKIDEKIKNIILDKKMQLNRAFIVDLSDITDFVKEIELSIATRKSLI